MRSLLAPLVNAGTATDVIYNLPASITAVFLEDDGIAGNGISQLRSATNAFDTTTFLNPTGSLTIHAGGLASALTISNLPDFSAALTLGVTNQPFKNITFAGGVMLAPDKNLFIAANAGSVSLPNAASRVATQGSGTIFVWGLASLAPGAALTSESGDITINNGFNAWTGSFTGIEVVGATISSRSGNITLNGHGGDSGDGNRGILIDAGASIVTGEQGSLNIQGVGGFKFDATTNPGVEIRGASVLETTGTGFVSVDGAGGSSSLGANSGLVLRDVGTTIRANAGGATVVGFSYGTKTGTNCAGVHISDGAIVAANTGSIGVAGYGKLGFGESTCHGLWLSGPATPSISSASAPGKIIRLTGAAGNPSMIGLKLDSVAASIVGDRNFDLYADRMAIAPAATVSAPSGVVEIRALYPNSGIDLGSSTDVAPNTLEISDADLDRITAEGIVVNLNTGGPIIISSDITRASRTHIRLCARGGIEFASGSIQTAGGNLDLWPFELATIGVKKAGNDAILGPNVLLDLGVPGNLRIGINGTAVDSQYDQFNALATISLRDFTLVLQLGFQPAVGDRFTIVNNVGSGQTINQFNHLPDGGFITVSGAFSADFQINYRGGDGNDVVLTTVKLSPALDPISNPIPIVEDADTQSLGLTGIAPGFGHSILKVTAVSSNPALIPDPGIVYSSVNGTGTLSYQPVTNRHGTATITVTVQDDGGTANGRQDTATRTFVVSVTPVNDPPRGSDGTLVVRDCGDFVLSIFDFGFHDPNDSPANNFMAVRITTTPNRGTLTISGSPVVAGEFISVSAILAGQLRFNPTSLFEGQSAVFTFQVQDNGGTTSGGGDLDPIANSLGIFVSGRPDRPPFPLHLEVNTFEDIPYVFLPSDFPLNSSYDFYSDKVVSLTVRSLPAVGALTLNNLAVTVGQTILIGDIAAGRFRYTPPPDAFGLLATFSVGVLGDGGTCTTFPPFPADQQITISALPRNDPPSGVDKTVTTNEDTVFSFQEADFAFTDPADFPSFLAAVVIGLLPLQGGTLRLASVPVTSGQEIPRHQLGGLTFTPVLNTNSKNTVAPFFTFQVRDSGGTFFAGVDLDPTPNTITIDVTPVNDAPVGTDKIVNPFPQATLLEDGSYAFSPADFDFSDPNDSPANSFAAITITTLPTRGWLTLGGVIQTTVLFSVSVASLSTLSFVPAPNQSGFPYATLTFQVQDDGGTANGGSDTDTTPNTMTFNVGSVNDAPSGGGRTVTIGEDSDYAFAASDFGFRDLNDSPPNSLLSVRIASLPAAGHLELNGEAIAFDQIVTVTAASLGTLRYFPVPNANGLAYAAFGFQVIDDGGTANGGSQMDPTPDTITFNVTPINDPPSGADKSLALGCVQYVFDASDFGYSDLADFQAHNLAGVLITSLPVSGFLTNNGTPVVTNQLIPLADLNLGRLVYSSSPVSGGGDAVSIGFQAQDDGGTANGGINTDQTSNTISIVHILGPITAPNGIDSVVTTNEDKEHVFSLADFPFVDAQNNNLKSITITSLPGQGVLTNNGVNVFANDRIPAIDITSGKLKFQPLPVNSHGSFFSSFRFRVQDDGGTCGGLDTDATPATITLSVLSVNDPPSGADQTFGVHSSPLIFSPFSFEFNDQQDTPGNSWVGIRIASLPTIGSLTVNGVAPAVGQFVPLEFIAGGLLRFQPSPAFLACEPTAGFSFQVQDSGGTANGGLDLDPTPSTFFFRTFILGIENSPPRGTSGAVSTSEDVAYPFRVSDFGFSDPEGIPNDLRAVIVSSLPANGQLLNNGIAVTPGQVITVGDILAGNLNFLPSPNASGAPFTSFTFQVQDDGGSAGCGSDFDPSPNTITINVTPINDPPSFLPILVPPVSDEGGLISIATQSSVGPPDEGGQKVTQFFVAGVLNAGLFSVSPQFDADGNLTFEPKPNIKGTAQITVGLKDDGGTANGGIDTDASQTLTIEVFKSREWHNALKPLDVSGEGSIDAGDALDVINLLNAFGPRPAPEDGRAEGPYYDSNGDSFVTAADALDVINHLNAFGPDVEPAAGEGPSGEGAAPPAGPSVTNDTTGPDGRPNAVGAVGPNNIVELTNFNYSVFDKSGQILTRQGLGHFWNAAMVPDRTVNEVQRLRFEHYMVGASFHLIYGAHSQKLDFSQNPHTFLKNVQTALDAIFGAGNTRTFTMATPLGEGGAAGHSVDVIFCGQLAGASMQSLKIVSTAPWLHFYGEPTGGTFRLTIQLPDGPVTTAPIFYGRQTISFGAQKALDDVLGVGAAKFIYYNLVTEPKAIITFNESVFGSVPPHVTVDPSGLIGGTAAVGIIDDSRSNETHRLTITGNPTGGTFSLTVQNPLFPLDRGVLDKNSIATTRPISLGATPAETASNIQFVLTVMSVLRPGNVAVSAVSENQFDVMLIGEYANYSRHQSGIIIPVTADGSKLTGGVSPAIEVGLPFDDGDDLIASSTRIHGAGSEIQRLSLAGSAASGVLGLAYGPGMVERVPWSDDRRTLLGRLQTKLNSLFGAGNTKALLVSDDAIDVVFCGQLAGASVSPLLVLETPPGVSAVFSQIARGIGNEQQRLSLDNTITGGSFTLAYGPALSQSVAWSSDPRELRGRIQQALSIMFGPENVLVLPADASNHEFDILFHGRLAATDMISLTVTDALGGGGVSLRAIADGSGNEVQRLGISGPIASGTVRLSLDESPPVSFEWNADPAIIVGALQQALDELLGVGNSRAFIVAGDQFDIVFQGRYSGVDVSPLSVQHTNETQQIAFTGEPGGGFFTLSVPLAGGTVHANIPYLADAELAASFIARELDFALHGMYGQAICEMITPTVFNVTFVGGLAGVNVPQMTVDTTNLMPSSAVSGSVATLVEGGLIGSGTLTVATIDDGGGNVIQEIGPSSFFYPAAGGATIKLLYGDALSPSHFHDLVFTTDSSIMKARYQEALVAVFGQENMEFFDRPDGSLGYVFVGELANTLMDPVKVKYAGGTLHLSPRAYPNQHRTHLEDSRVVFDQRSGRWFAVTTAIRAIHLFLKEDDRQVLLAVSNTSDPLDGWQAVSIDPDLLDKHIADSPMLGVDADGVYVTVKEFSTSHEPWPVPIYGLSVVSIPKADLLGETPTAANATVHSVNSTKLSAAGPIAGMQPVVDFGPADGRHSLITHLGGSYLRSDIVLQRQMPGHDAIDPRVHIVGGPNYAPPPDAPQPGENSALLRIGEGSLRSSVVKEGNSLWFTYSAEVDGRAGVRWIEIDATSNTVKQSGDIGGRPSDGDFSYYYPSLAVNEAGYVVIGFTGSSPTQYPSAFYVVGHTVNGVTSFGDAVLMKAGVGIAKNGHLGEYSATVTDPSDPYEFWTFQEYVPYDDGWGINVGKVSLAPANRPQAHANSYEAVEDQSLIVAFAAGVLSNDLNPVGGPLSARLVQEPAHGKLTLNADGSFSYVPKANFSGDDSFTYWAMDGAVLSLTTTVSIAVKPANDAPASADSYVTAHRNAAYVFSPADFLLVDAADSLAGTLQAVRIVTLPRAGALTLSDAEIQAGTIISAADLAGEKLRFTPALDATAMSYAAFDFQVQDAFHVQDDSAANPEIDFSSPHTFHIDVLDASAWHNVEMPFDVNDDAYIVANDALLIINYLNAGLPNEIGAGEAIGGSYLDTDNDGFVAASDALEVINFLNAGLGGEGESREPFTAASDLHDVPSDAAPVANDMDELATLLAMDLAAESRKKKNVIS